MVKNKHGQYFTKNIKLKEKLFDFILNKPLNILEPCVGMGDLVEFILKQIPNIKFDMYEIDESIKILDSINIKDIIYGDFLSQKIDKTYKTIIGNPPYIKTKEGNLYIKFIEKCYNLLKDDGELIFIVPSDFFKLTSALKLINTMLSNGNFTHIYHPNDERLFENANIDIIIFRYCKNKYLEKTVLYNDKVLYINYNDCNVMFETEINKNTIMFKDVFEISVGIVSGMDKVFKHEQFGNIDVLVGESKKEKYIFIKEYPCNDTNINAYLEKNKMELMSRKIKKFNITNWFEWGALRNYNTIISNLGKECIYVYNITRRHNVAFVGNVGYFSGTLLMLRPKKFYKLQYIVDYINSDEFKSKFMYSKRFKIGHRNLSNSYIPDKYLIQ